MLVGIAFLALGIAIVIAEVRRLQRARATAHWPRVGGRILTRSVHPGSMQRGDQAPDIRYEYEVNGQRYESAQLDVTGRFGGTPGRVAQALMRYEPGQKVRVYYDPEDPSRAVLETSVDASLYFRIAFGVVIAFLGFSFL
jgi:hypothetical protein